MKIILKQFFLGILILLGILSSCKIKNQTFESHRQQKLPKEKAVLDSIDSMAEKGFTTIFNGKDLTGWQALDMTHWSIKDKAITGTISKEYPLNRNSFLVWQKGELADFELRLKCRIISKEPDANGGIQFRSELLESGALHGYQADFAIPEKYMATLYDEGSERRLLCERGKKTMIDEDGNRTETTIGNAKQIYEKIHFDGQWNDYTIFAKGHDIMTKINGRVAVKLSDHQKGHYDATGILALQLHSGGEMIVQYKDIRLRKF